MFVDRYLLIAMASMSDVALSTPLGQTTRDLTDHSGKPLQLQIRKGARSLVNLATRTYSYIPSDISPCFDNKPPPSRHSPAFGNMPPPRITSCRDNTPGLDSPPPSLRYAFIFAAYQIHAVNTRLCAILRLFTVISSSVYTI